MRSIILMLSILSCSAKVLATQHELNISPSLTVCTEVTTHSNITQPIIGNVIEQVSIAAQNTGIDLEIVRYPWNRCLNDVKNQKLDGIFALIWTPERDKFLIFPQGSRDGSNQQRIAVTSYYFFENREQPLDISNLKYGIGAPMGYVVREQLQANGLLSPINYSVQEGIIMVGRKKLDAYLVGEEIGRIVINSLNLQDQVRMKQPPHFAQDLHIAFNKTIYNQHNALLQRLWEELERMRLTSPESE